MHGEWKWSWIYGNSGVRGTKCVLRLSKNWNLSADIIKTLCHL